MNTRSTSLFLAAMTLFAFHSDGGDFPRRIVVTLDEIKEIREKGTLHGRPVCKLHQDCRKEAIWDGIRVFTGKKSDIIGWLQSPQNEARNRMGGDQYTPSQYVENFQYDILCKCLLDSEDQDVKRAVIWHYIGMGTGYLNPEWKQLAGDKSLSVAERAMADIRGAMRQTNGCMEAFLRHKDELQTHDIVCMLVDMKSWMGSGLPEYLLSDISHEDKKALLLPTLRREYLDVTVGTTPIVRIIADILGQMEKDTDVQAVTLDRLVECDRLGDERSALLWYGINSSVDAERLRTLAMTATVPRNAATAFYAYANTPVGQKQVVNTPGGWQKHFQSYLQAAFARNDRAYDFLRAMAGEFLLPPLNRGNVTLTVTAEQKKILDSAWKDVPDALKHVQVKEEPKEDEK